MKSFEKILKKIAHFQVENPYFTLMLIFIFTIFIYGGVSQVKTVSSLEQMMPTNIEEISAFNILRDNYLGQDMIAIVLEIDRNSVIKNSINDISSKSVYDYIKKLDLNLKLESDIIDTYSYAKVLDFYSNNSINSSNYNLYLNKNKISTESSNFINNDKTLSVIILRTDVSANDERMNLLSTKIKQILADLPPPAGVKIKLTGTPIIQQKLGELINNDRSNTQWISMLFVFTITMLIFRSILSAIVPIIIVFISVNWLYGTMGYTSLPISTLAGGVAAMVVGIGIDFAIHIINKFKFERKLGISIKKSVEYSVVQTGSALIATSITTIFAFLTFIVGVMPEMGRFGILMAIGIIYSLFFSIFGLPALLVIEEKIIYYFKNKLRFGIENEFHLEKNKK